MCALPAGAKRGRRWDPRTGVTVSGKPPLWALGALLPLHPPSCQKSLGVGNRGKEPPGKTSSQGAHTGPDQRNRIPACCEDRQENRPTDHSRAYRSRSRDGQSYLSYLKVRCRLLPRFQSFGFETFPEGFPVPPSQAPLRSFACAVPSGIGSFLCVSSP